VNLDNIEFTQYLAMFVIVYRSPLYLVVRAKYYNRILNTAPSSCVIPF